MIEENTIKLGYGDVVIGSSPMGYIKFTEIKPPVECGTHITKDMELEYGESLVITEDNDLEFYRIAKQLSPENCIVKYKEYTIDCTNYNKKSVEVLLRHANNMVNWLVLAC